MACLPQGMCLHQKPESTGDDSTDTYTTSGMFIHSSLILSS